MGSPGKSNSNNKPLRKGQQPLKPDTEKNSKKPKQPVQDSALQKLDKWIEPRLNIVFNISLLLTIFFGAFLFELKISTGGDDSHYIEMANDFIKGRSFPTWHGPLYPIFLSLPMLVLGVKVFALKIFSFIFIIAHLVFFYLAFKRNVSPFILALIMLIISVNSSILYFSSQTYSEAMYMFLQSLVIFLFVKTYQTFKDEEKFIFKIQAFPWFVLGFFIFLMSITRDIGIMVLAAVVLVLLTEKKLIASLVVIASYVAFFVPFKLYKSIVWHTGSQRPFSEILLKNFYNPADGYEDFSGMVVRIFENSRLYFSKHFMIALGLHDPFSTEKSWLVTGIVILLFLISLYYAFKKSKILLFVAVYLLAAVSATFFALQQSWDQMRMIIIYVPMLLLLLAWGIQQISERKGLAFLSVLLPFILVFIFFKTLGHSVEKVKINQKVLSKNLSGNMYYGFTPDWQNYLLMSRWVGDNIPDTVVVASRKPSMSFIYSHGRDFYGMYRFPSYEPGELVNGIKARIGDMLVIPNSDFDRSFPPAVKMSFKQAAVGYVAEGNTIYGLYEMKEPMGSVLKKATVDFKVSSFTTDSLLNRVKVSRQNCFAVSPDSLVNTLKRNKVSYIIVASLRANPNMNTGNIINNIQRYLFFVEQKYPGILSLVHQIGDDAGEPAWLYRVNYNIYHL
jgi:hypothetical protein